MEAQQPGLAVDCVVFDPLDRLLLIRRKNPPFQGQFAFPGGFVEYGETVEEAAFRVLEAETGIKSSVLHVAGVYSEPNRDPRKHIITIAFFMLPDTTDPRTGPDAITAEFVGDWRSAELAFDHSKILGDACRLRELIQQGSV
ncbi:MAG: NUDIX domain-containing protein [Bryobacteraceae bacterium]